MADCIIISDIAVNAIIGVQPEERIAPQPISVNLKLYVDLLAAGRTDSIEHTVNYATVTKAVAHLTKMAECLTLEALAALVAGLILGVWNDPAMQKRFEQSMAEAKLHWTYDDRITKITVRIDKPKALKLARSPAVKITRTRQFLLSQKFETAAVEGEPLTPVYIALGSNLDDRKSNIEEGLRLLTSPEMLPNNRQVRMKILKTSRLFETPPAYVIDQPAFLNCAAEIDTDIEPLELLQLFKSIEERVGRVKTIRNGPRKLDIDLLMYGNRRINIPGKNGGLEGSLIVPHPLIHERDFVLGPLNDLCPNVIHPKLGLTIHQLFQGLKSVQLQPVCYLSRDRHFAWGKKTNIMGVLNVTPDSFSDGGKYETVESAIRRAGELLSEGADVIDVGGQSTRPNSERIDFETEISRVIPVIEGIRREYPKAIISIDTFYAKVAERAVQAGADIVNDISGGTIDSDMLPTVSKLKVPIILSHIRGDPQTMSQMTQYDDVIDSVKKWFHQRIQQAHRHGIYDWNILLDPGIGFAKEQEHNLQLLRPQGDLRSLHHPILFGTSRKKFIGTITGREKAEERLLGTVVSVVAAVVNGADMVRVHDVREMKEALLMADAIYRSK